MARFINEFDESKMSIYKKEKKKINFVFNINCFMILVACVYLSAWFILKSDSLREKKNSKKKEEKERASIREEKSAYTYKKERERDREQSTFFSHARESANPFVLWPANFSSFD